MREDRRYLSLWLPYWAAEAWMRRHPSPPDPRPFALLVSGPHGRMLAGLDAMAQAEGLWPGQPLTDARALVPNLRTAAHEPEATAAHLGRLADWCDRFSPAVALDGADALLLDITGCAHLFGGEQALLDQIQGQLAGQGLTARLAIADSPAAAWAWGHYGPGGVLPEGASRQMLAALPVAALRLPPEIVTALHRVGLRRLADLLVLPRGPTSLRFGRQVLQRLDQALGVAAEPLALRRPPPRFLRRMGFAEPIGQRDSVDAALLTLLQALCADLHAAGQGARQVVLGLFRVDGARQDFTIGTSQPNRDPTHLARLFRETLDGLDPGFGIELAELAAPLTDAFTGQQVSLGQKGGGGEALAQLIDRLGQRLGGRRVQALVPVASHWPDRATRPVAPLAGLATQQAWPARPPRPLWLLPQPEAVAADAPGSALQAPPGFRWRGGRHVVAWAQGPERIAPEWWRLPPDDPRQAAPPRDYWQVEDAQGRRFWLFRAQADWFVHGEFA